MGDIQTRPFSKNYSGLVNQSVFAVCITVICVTCQEYMRRKRRKTGYDEEGLGSRESWEFGYLFQGRSWARNPSPPLSRGWPLSWVKQAVDFPEDKLLELRGIDATLYIRFLRACFWYTLLHTLTTFPILFPIHVRFSAEDIPPKSMTRASITSLVATDKGLSLLWIHVCLLFWITLTWMATLLWVCDGAFKLRACTLDVALKNAASPGVRDAATLYHRHPHPQYRFNDVPIADRNHPNKGLRLRTIMVSNVPLALRNEKDLKNYFEYYMSRKPEKTSMAITSSTQPGIFSKYLAYLFNRAKHIPAHLPPTPLLPRSQPSGLPVVKGDAPTLTTSRDLVPIIDCVVIVRKMTELASLLERREEVLRLLETAHIKLANKTLAAVKAAMDRKAEHKPFSSGKTRAGEVIRNTRHPTVVDVEEHTERTESTSDEMTSMEQLIEVLGPYVEEFSLQDSLALRYRRAISTRPRIHGPKETVAVHTSSITPGYPPSSLPSRHPHGRCIWEALHTLPRRSLDAYQPLVNLSHLYRGKVVPSIDYYTVKLNLLSSLIIKNRAKPSSDYDPVSTAFVTFANPADARRACNYLAVHPKNPLMCSVTMAPMYQDLDWIRVMKSSFNVEFVKDWVVNLGVWAFTLFWLFPVSLLVGLVSIQNISLFWPSLKSYLDRHMWEEELIQSFLPTFLVALLALLIPLILLLIAKKAHTITTLSALHDTIMIRYYKFLIVNVLVFFCVGTAAMQSVLQSFRSPTSSNILQVVTDSFPAGGPFYVGWLIFTTAIHGGFELTLFGLPLIMYPSTSRQITPRKRAVGIRPRTLNFYYWLPNHLLVIHVLLLFAVLNPFVLPFGTLYFFTQAGVMKNQLIHVYAKHYEANGHLILIRVVRYSLDGLILAQAVFLAYMVVLKKGVNVGLAAVLIVLTSIVKILMTRMCRAQFEKDDIAEAEIVCGRHETVDMRSHETPNDNGDLNGTSLIQVKRRHSSLYTWKLPAWMNFTHSTLRHKHPHSQKNPDYLGPQSRSFSRLNSISQNIQQADKSDAGMQPTPPPSPRDLPDGGTLISPGLTTDTNGSTEKSDLVTAHPLAISWDDQTTVDLPYDNPFYTRTYDDVLWLPRNPCGTLNLDDTLDLKVSLTTDVSAGQLGTWLSVPETSSFHEIPQGVGRESKLLGNWSDAATTSSPPVDGTEDIDLPPDIARRVQLGEDGVEQAARPRRPSTFRPKFSGGDKIRINMGSADVPSQPSPPDMGDLTSPPSIRSFSDGRGRAGSSSMSIPNLRRTWSTDLEPGLRPDFHAQAELVTVRGTSSRISLPPRSENIPAHVAIAQEVVAEEEAALVNRIEDEKTEAHKATATKSWLTSWMFKKSA